MPKQKHLFNKKIRDKNSGFCPTSLWGPFCECCRDKMHKKMAKAFKNIDVNKVLSNLNFEEINNKVKSNLANDSIRKGYRNAFKFSRN